MSEQTVSVVVRNDDIFVTSSSQTVDGFWVDNGSVERLPGDTTDEELGSAVLRARARSETGVENPRGEAPGLAALLAAAGVSSWAEFSKGLRSLSMYFHDAGAVVYPYRNNGPRKDHTPILEATETFTELDPTTIGRTARRGLERAGGGGG
jgi:hypothetical protein